MSFDVAEATIDQMQAAMASGETTSRGLVLQYLARIAASDKDGLTLNSVLELNPDALFIADSLDAERSRTGPRSPLHGIPVLLKDNIDTGDQMHTSAGSLALAQSFAPRDARLVKGLRAAGAVILGKANMTEFANFMTAGMPTGYSSRGGQVLNPYNLSAATGGSSAGSAVAVACSFCAAAVGTETSGSILNPAGRNSVVGLKPTVGLVSRSGIIPISRSQDTAGPMARTVRDAALLLNAMTGSDEEDPATAAAGPLPADYSAFLDPDGLKGARIGIPRDYYFEEVEEERRGLFDRAVERMKELGAVIVDPADIPTSRQILYSSVLLNEFKNGLEHYLSRLGPGAPVRTLGEIIAFNHAHPLEALRYGQSLLLDAEYRTSGSLTETAYLRDRLTDLKLCRTEGIDAVMRDHRLAALLFPADFGSRIAARAGYPSLIVPAGRTAEGVPFGVTFTARAYEEPLLFRLAYAFELHTQARAVPSLKSFL